MIKYSIVIPAYNIKALLKNTLEALNYQQGFGKGDFEVIVVDDGSNDNTFDFIKGVNKNYDMEYIYIERDNKSCRSKARNRGVAEAKGEIIIFLDGDIIVKRDYLNEVKRCFEIGDQILVISTRLMAPEIPFESIGDGSIYEKYVFDGKSYTLTEPRHFLFNHLSYNLSNTKHPWFFAYSCNIAVYKKWLEKVGGFDENFINWGNEDVELAYRLYNAGVKFIINSKMEVLHQHHGSRTVQESKIKLQESNMYLVDKHKGIFGIPRKEALEVLNWTRLLDISVQSRGRGQKYVIDFKNKEQLDAVKQQIVKLSEQKNVEIIVNDYVEDTDLDMWIQMQEVKNSIPLYFPISKKFKQEINLTNFIKSK